METVYLDTSVLRSGSDEQLNRLNKGFRVEVAVFSVVELLNGIFATEADFRRRCASIRRGCDENFHMNWTLPDALVAQCFDALTVTEFRSDDLANLIRTVLFSENHEVARSSVDALKLKYGCAYFEYYDNKYGASWADKFLPDNKKLRVAFESEVRKGKIPATARFADHLNGIAQNKNLNESMTVMALARMIRESPALESSSAPAEDVIYDSYSGKHSVFVAALSRASMKMHANSEMPGRNDALDIAHFLYLRPQSILLTDDKKMSDLARSIDLRAMTLSEACY